MLAVVEGSVLGCYAKYDGDQLREACIDRADNPMRRAIQTRWLGAMRALGPPHGRNRRPRTRLVPVRPSLHQ